MRRFAEDTTVPVSRSRGHIDELLRAWGCSGIGWLDDFEHGMVELQFKWKHDETAFLARFRVKLPDDEALRAEARHARSGTFLPARFEKLCSERGRQEHRVLFLWLKAALNAVDSGIIDPATIFLPFLVTRNGQTFGEFTIPKLPQLLVEDPRRLLPEGR